MKYAHTHTHTRTRVEVAMLQKYEHIQCVM